MGKKKANGEGSITKRADGRYMGRFTVGSKRYTIYGATHEEVRIKLTEKLNAVAKGVFIEVGKDTFAAWLKEWLVTYALPTVKQSTYVSYEGYVRNHLIPELGNIKLAKLNREHLQRFFNKKFTGTQEAKGLSPKTLKNIYNMLNSVLEEALISNKIVASPLHGIKLPKLEKKEIRVLDPHEQILLQEAANRSPEIQAFGIIFTLSTGVRIGELCAFRWTDLNYFRHSIHIYRTAARLKKVTEDGNVIEKNENENTTELIVHSPKSNSSRREIPLFDELWNGLMVYKQKQLEMFDALGIEFDENGYIFCNSLGELYDPKTYDALFKRTLKEAGLSKINFHALRHTFATRALEAGMDIKVLSVLLGHAQPSTTLNLYAHALPDHKRTSMDKMSEYYTTSTGTTAKSIKLVS